MLDYAASPDDSISSLIGQRGASDPARLKDLRRTYRPGMRPDLRILNQLHNPLNEPQDKITPSARPAPSFRPGRSGRRLGYDALRASSNPQPEPPQPQPSKGPMSGRVAQLEQEKAQIALKLNAIRPKLQQLEQKAQGKPNPKLSQLRAVEGTLKGQREQARANLANARSEMMQSPAQSAAPTNAAPILRPAPLPSSPPFGGRSRRRDFDEFAPV
jgi:hypothetical protein